MLKSYINHRIFCSASTTKIENRISIYLIIYIFNDCSILSCISNKILKNKIDYHHSKILPKNTTLSMQLLNGTKNFV